ncbi:MAG: 16S rRNA (guanine(527)-N(7))-methyltransferase RsmG [Cryomorphaceae bacterium]|jgi:16S rRNA (guanine527-N7)-methyltransferase|nr:16S rRNA (guanine(527)-N(7))-methyltransferase RsmG [Cryomorphaceae bacterium]
MTLIEHYFPDLSPLQLQQFAALEGLYQTWNAQINVISRKDTDHFYERHVLHSLAIAKIIQFLPGASVLDIGTGGGFPGIPLAILFPEVQFHLVDSIGKKIKVVQEVAGHLGLQNVEASHVRAENVKDRYDFIVSRAVTQMPIFLTWVKGKSAKKNLHPFKNGVFYLKGGDLSEELAGLRYPVKEFPIADFYTEEFFETKKVVYVQLVP